MLGLLGLEPRREIGLNLHNDEDSNIDTAKSDPGEPADMRELAHTGTDGNNNRSDEREPDGTNRMQRQGIECSRYTNDTRRCDNHITNQEQEARELLHDRSTDQLGHIDDGVTARIGIAEVTLHNRAVSIK